MFFGQLLSTNQHSCNSYLALSSNSRTHMYVSHQFLLSAPSQSNTRQSLATKSVVNKLVKSCIETLRQRNIKKAIQYKMVKVAYTRRWVAATTKSASKQSTSDWTWASTSTSSEMSASSTSLQNGIATTIARQVRSRLGGRTVSRDDVIFQVHRELSDVFYMAMLPEFQDSIIDEVFNPATL